MACTSHGHRRTDMNIVQRWIVYNGAPSPNGDPSALVLTVLSETSIKLDWTNGATNQDGTYVIKKLHEASEWDSPVTALGNLSTKTITGLTSGTLYDFKVVHYKGSKLSNYSNTASDYTFGYSIAEIQAKIAAGYIPIANADDLNAINTTYSGGSTRNFAVGTIYETGQINTTGLAGKYIQVQNISLDHATLTALYGGIWYSATAGWPQIAPTGGSSSFSGIYDGSEFEITSMYQRGATQYGGLFGKSSAGASFKNIRLYNIDVLKTYNSALEQYSGGLIGLITGTTIENVYVSGTINVKKGYNGGIVGYAQTTISTINRCYFNGTVTTLGTHTGGIIGSAGAHSITLKNCYVNGTVGASDYCGGIIGYAYFLSLNNEGIFRSWSNATINCTGTYNGGAVGRNNISTITNVYYDTTTSGKSDTGKGIPLPTTQLQTPTHYTYDVGSGTIVYDAWSGYYWNFGTSSEYATLKRIKLDYPIIADFQSAWTKSASNPLITPVGKEIYPVGVIYTNSKYYLFGKMNNTVIGQYSSSDGISWTFVQNAIEQADMPVSWKTFSKYEYQTIIYKDSVFYIIFGIEFSDGTAGVGVASSSTIEGNYVINNSMVIDPDNNTTYETIGIDFTFINAPECVRIGDTYHWFGNVAKNGTYYIVRYTSPSSDWLNLTPVEIVISGADTNALMSKRGHVVQIPRIYYYDGYYYMTLTIGGDQDVIYQRDIYVLKSSSITGFGISNWQRTPIVVSDGVNTWNELRVYAHDILKETDDYRLTPKLVSGKIRMYFAGHAITGHFTPVYTGVPGLAELTV